MYLKRIYLENIACFEKLSIELNNSNNSGLFSLFLGDNGVGKTTLLRCIALGMCNESGAAALVRELQGDLVRIQGDQYNSIIELELYESNPNKTVTIRTEITETGPGDIELSQHTWPKNNFPWEKIFLCGYGSWRGKYEHQEAIHYFPVDAVYTLFNYEAKLQNPELIIRRMKSTAKEKQILNTFDDILMLSKGSTILSDKGLGFEGSGVDKITIGGWGDGHRATLGWLADLFSWDILYKNKGSMSDIVGIVLLDEIEHHLHPSWQRRIIRQLNRNFPKIQFIVTSHSPLCAIGTTDLPEDIANVFLLRLKNDSSHLIEGGNSIRGMRADQVLTSYLFGLESTRSDDTAMLIERYLALSVKDDLTKRESLEKKEIKKTLDKLLGSAETKLQRVVELEVRKAIDQYILENSDLSNLTSDAVMYETRRQLKKIFKDRK